MSTPVRPALVTRVIDKGAEVTSRPVVEVHELEDDGLHADVDEGVGAVGLKEIAALAITYDILWRKKVSF